MDWESLGAVGEMIGAIAVVASLLFVGNQLRQSQRAERAAGQRDLLNQGRSWYTSTRRDPQLFHIVSRLLEDYDGADPEARNAFDTWAFGYLLILEQVLYMHDDEFVNATSRKGFEDLGLSILATPGGRQWWRQARTIWNQDHVAHMERRLADTPEIPRFDALAPQFAAQREKMAGECRQEEST